MQMRHRLKSMDNTGYAMGMKVQMRAKNSGADLS
eukprot:CAMPEP_0169269886 /NCGR_PEP_ID=MMETSP1016-20121227/48740_1 /TAXON_ID=342587 /ORGANISM="Karlodinium micrum, Strain CCMP2283" /LENGTH=33 /DNA_ID= /DNA_START= /DNA_END= /DNA_ORIENTATION=